MLLRSNLRDGLRLEICDLCRWILRPNFKRSDHETIFVHFIPVSFNSEDAKWPVHFSTPFLHLLYFQKQTEGKSCFIEIIILHDNIT